MTFVYPEFLFALAALSIPVIIHLFNFRRFKKVVFTNVRFLQEIKKDTDSRTRLKHLLVLLCRLSALAFLVLAFARPYFPGEKVQTAGANLPVSIFLDNSFSMQAIGKNGSLFEEGKSKVRDIVSASGPGTRFQLLTCDFEARHQRLYSKPEILQMLDELKPSPSVKMLSQILPRQSEAIKTVNSKGGSGYVLSDFQTSISDLESVKTDSLIVYHLIPLSGQKAQNITLDSCYFSSPVFQAGQSLEITAVLKNHSASTVENVPIKLFINGKQKGLSSIGLDGEAVRSVKIPFSISDTGYISGSVNITDYPVTFDDTYYFSFNMSAKAPVLCINGQGENKFITGVYKTDEFFSLKNVSENQLDFSSFPNYRLIILDEIQSISSGLAEELKKYLNNGGSVIIFPAVNADLNSYNTCLQSFGANTFSLLNTQETKVDKLNLDDELMKDVFLKIPENIDLPEVKKYFSQNKATRSNEELLLRLRSGESFLSLYHSGKGKLYLFTSPPQSECTNFIKHALFVPVMYKIALLGANQNVLSHTIGNEEAIETEEAPSGRENVVHLHKTDGSFDFIPEIKNLNGKPHLLVHDQVKESGNYLVSGTNLISAISFNYDRKESETNCLNAASLAELTDKSGMKNIHVLDPEAKNFNAGLTAAERGTQLWKYFLILALICLAAEVCILRFWK